MALKSLTGLWRRCIARRSNVAILFFRGGQSEIEDPVAASIPIIHSLSNPHLKESIRCDKLQSNLDSCTELLFPERVLKHVEILG